jgi:hypothetical protein
VGGPQQNRKVGAIRYNHEAPAEPGSSDTADKGGHLFSQILRRVPALILYLYHAAQIVIAKHQHSATLLKVLEQCPVVRINPFWLFRTTDDEAQNPRAGFR